MRNPRLVAAAALLALCSGAQAQIALSESFNDVTALAGSGWLLVNTSAAPLGTSWFQGNAGVFPAASGPADAYAAANFLGTGALTGAVSNWLITPQLQLQPGAGVSLAVRAAGGGLLDTLEVRLSTTGTAPADFSTLLGSYASTTDQGWVTRNWAVPLSAATPSYIAFRYVISDVATAGNYLGIDNVVITAVPEPTTSLLIGLGLAGLLARRRLAA